jgi:hypothetical protein
MNIIQFQERIKKALSNEFGDVDIKSFTLLVNNHNLGGSIDNSNVYNLKFTINSNIIKNILKDKITNTMAIKMYVECIGKPSKEEFRATDVTIGKIYPVKWIDGDDYQIIDDKGKVRYYRHGFFKDAEWQTPTK